MIPFPDRRRGIGSRRFPEFSAELRDLTGIDNGYRRCGGIEFLLPEDAGASGVWHAEGIAFERLTGDEARRLDPAALLARDLGRVFAASDLGIATPEPAAFVGRPGRGF